MLKWFRRRQKPDTPPLFERPQPGDQIELDEEELEAAVQTDFGRVIQNAEIEGRRFPDPIKSEIEDFAIAQGLARLLDLARRRLDANNFTGAARTCVKVVGICGTMHDPSVFTVHEAWLLLAEIHAEYGDMGKSRASLDIANEKVNEVIEALRQQGSESLIPYKEYEAEWKAKTMEISNRLRSKRTHSPD